MEYSNLLWLSGNDIPFPEAAITVHSPTIKEIGYIGEDEFFLGCNLLNFNKEEFLKQLLLIICKALGLFLSQKI